MMGLGFQELIVILVIIVVLFGATRLPQLGKGLGEGISNFKRGLKSSDNEIASGNEKKNEAEAATTTAE